MRLNSPTHPGSLPLEADGMRLFPEPLAREIAASFDVTRLTPEFYADPFPVYHALRMYAPVHWMQHAKSFLVSRHADLEAIYKDTATYSSDKRIEFKPKYGDGPLYEHHTSSLVFSDPPLHTRVRSIIAGALTARAIADMEAPVTGLVDRLIEAMAAKGKVDLIEDFASAIPVEVIGNLLGVPHADRGPLRGWSLAILGALEPVLTPEQLALGNRSVTEFKSYLVGLVAERRCNPGDPAKDVLTRLIQGEAADGGKLSETELLQNVIFLLNAGHETTTNLIGNGLYTLLMWPGERRRLIESPGLIKTAVEEMLRFESSNQLGNRRTMRSVEIGGVKIPEGSSITLAMGAANRDPERFPRPDVFDIVRQPNRHLAFASGPHQCVGLNVARLEGRIAVERFLRRFPDYELSGPPVPGGRARFRGFLSIPARVA